MSHNTHPDNYDARSDTIAPSSTHVGCVCMCACVCMRARARVCVRVRVCACARVRVCGCVGEAKKDPKERGASAELEILCVNVNVCVCVFVCVFVCFVCFVRARAGTKVLLVLLAGAAGVLQAHSLWARGAQNTQHRRWARVGKAWGGDSTTNT